MEYAVKIIDSLAWPSVVLVLSFMFRRSLGLLTERMSKFKYKGVEANFGQELQKLEGEVKKLPTHTHLHHDKKYWEKMTARGLFTQWEQIKRISETSPKAAILEAWLDVEISVSSAASSANIDTNEFSTAISQARKLMENGHLPGGVWAIITDLNKIKRKVENAHDFSISYEETMKFFDLALKTGNEFRNFAMDTHLAEVNKKHNKPFKQDK